MQQLYFIRHGLSEMNIQSQWAGHSDTPLTEEGHTQAKQAGELAKKQGLSFDIIVSSPLQRAHHTAQHIARKTGYAPDDIVIDGQFIERNYGSLEGHSSQSPTGKKYFLDETYIDDHLRVEPLWQLQDRANRALQYLRALDYETVLVVSHGAFGRALYRAINDLPLTKRDIRYANAEIVRFI